MKEYWWVIVKTDRWVDLKDQQVVAEKWDGDWYICGETTSLSDDQVVPLYKIDEPT